MPDGHQTVLFSQAADRLQQCAPPLDPFHGSAPNLTDIDVATVLDAAIADDLRAALFLHHQALAIRGHRLDLAGMERVALRFGTFGQDPYVRAPCPASLMCYAC